MHGLPEREIRKTVLGEKSGGGYLGGCLGFWGTGDLDSGHCYCRLRRWLLGRFLQAPITVLILVVRVVIGQSYYRCPDVETDPSSHLPMARLRRGPGQKSWGRKWVEMGMSDVMCSLQCSSTRPQVGHRRWASLPSVRIGQCCACNKYTSTSICLPLQSSAKIKLLVTAFFWFAS